MRTAIGGGAVALVLIFYTVASGEEGAAVGDPEVKRVAVNAIPPFVITDQGASAGFSIDLWHAIAAAVDIRTEFVVLQSVADIIDAYGTW